MSLMHKLEPLRFSDDILNDLRKQLEEEEAQQSGHQALGTDGEDPHTDESEEEEEGEEEESDDTSDT